MLTPDIEVLKDQVEDEIQLAFEQFCKNEIKKTKAQLYDVSKRAEEYKDRATKLEACLRNMDSKELRSKFFERDICRDTSPYLDSLR